MHRGYLGGIPGADRLDLIRERLLGNMASSSRAVPDFPSLDRPQPNSWSSCSLYPLPNSSLSPQAFLVLWDTICPTIRSVEGAVPLFYVQSLISPSFSWDNSLALAVPVRWLMKSLRCPFHADVRVWI